MSRPLPQPKIPKPSTTFPKGEIPKARHKMQFPKVSAKPPRVAKLKPPKITLPKVKPEFTKVTRTTKAR